jgi:hypothetical protein
LQPPSSVQSYALSASIIPPPGAGRIGVVATDAGRMLHTSASRPCDKSDQGLQAGSQGLPKLAEAKMWRWGGARMTAPIKTEHPLREAPSLPRRGHGEVKLPASPRDHAFSAYL